MTNPVHKLPVFGVNHMPSAGTLDSCVGWARDEQEAFKLVESLPETQETASMMSRQFGVEYSLAGVSKERMILKDDEGPHYSSTIGYHRYQEVYRAFLDSKRDQ